MKVRELCLAKYNRDLHIDVTEVPDIDYLSPKAIQQEAIRVITEYVKTLKKY
jgi:hypothetical protein